ncbi:MAG: metallophosphoesterase, partial [Lentisphaeria bacterium]|nr:metallophosphoesterase [Lentisphaeria bacterium]
MRLAILSDIHYMSAPPTKPFARCGEYGDTFLLRAVRRFNRFIKPDVVLVAGDLIHDPNDPAAEGLLEELKKTLNILTVPYLVIPGNHDPAHELFYRVFADHKEP